MIYQDRGGKFMEIDNFYGSLGKVMTNNMAEIIALIVGIRRLKEHKTKSMRDEKLWALMDSLLLKKFMSLEAEPQ